ncbi:MAG: glycosyltransferase family 4 protein [Lentisphaerae bacterium]|nr:glycosyltransferase family 4 protein [Lentisphaerota bacterium]
MHIGIVVSYTPDARIGGAQIQAWELAKRLAARHAVTLFARRLGARPARETVDGVTVARTRVVPVPGLRMLSHIVFSVAAVCRQRPRPDTLLCFTTHPGGVVGMLAKALSGIPFCVSIRGGDWYFLLPHAWGRVLLRAVFRAGNRVIVQAQRIAREVHESFPFVTLEVIPNGIESGPEPSGSEGRRLVFVGNLLKRKGVGVLLEALRQCPDMPLLIVGDGPERESLRRSAQGMNVEFRGAVSPDEARALICAEGRILVLPAVAGEGLPNVLMEAMSAGVPVIASDVAGVRDLLEDGRAGLIVPPGEASALAAAIRRLWNDEAARRRLAAAGRDAVRKYAWETVLPRYEAALTSIRRIRRQP